MSGEVTTTTSTTPVKCLGCRRTLRSARSIARGYGPTCARKINHAAKTVDLSDYKPFQVTKALELIAELAIIPARPLYLAVSSQGDTAYEVDPAEQTCSCPAGQHGRRCYHLAAATILAAA